MRRGFTLMEMAAVLTVMGLIVAVSVPAYDSLVKRAHTEEARGFLEAIVDAELRHFRDTGHYLACEGAPPGEAGCWQTLGLRAEGPLRYRYAVRVNDAGFVASARGDLDRDGVESLFELDGRTRVLTVTGALE